MDPESKKLLQATFEIAKENNDMLHKVRGVQKRAALFSIFKLLLIIGLSYGAFVYLEPYFDKVINAYNSIATFEQKVETNSSAFQEFLNKFKK
ncbi:MAG: hypothetical protein AAB438_03220 [Patescibacteria group bacterium]